MTAASPALRDMLNREPIQHALKTLSEPYRSVLAGRKRAELRFDDRDFRIGDTLLLREWGPRKGYTGREVTVVITDITRLYRWIEGIDNRWCMLSFAGTE